MKNLHEPGREFISLDEQEADLEHNIRVLQTGTFLYEEPKFFRRQELRDRPPTLRSSRRWLPAARG